MKACPCDPGGWGRRGPAARPDRRPRGCRAGEAGQMKGYLLVRSEGKSYGLPVGRVLEVGDATEVLSIPRKLPAVRGSAPLRGPVVPLHYLGAVLSGPPGPALAAVLTARL